MKSLEEPISFGWPAAEYDQSHLPLSDHGGALRREVQKALDLYFQQLGGQPATDLYAMVLNEIEAPLIAAVMKYSKNNQSKASTMLGLNRGTLRKKLKQHGLL
jgi:Fis family transcriptional regulator, factor for inversion stimulation protein